jgi:hypothetical protein
MPRVPNDGPKVGSYQRGQGAVYRSCLSCWISVLAVLCNCSCVFVILTEDRNLVMCDEKVGGLAVGYPT